MGDVNDRQPTASAVDHARHDELLVTRYAAGDPYPSELAEARRLVDGCAACASLANDIRLISRATAALPAPRRRRDFRLTAEQAEALRGSSFERLLRRLTAPGMAGALRPVAGVALSLGIVLAIAGAGLPQAALPATAPATTPSAAGFGPAQQGGEEAAPAAEGPQRDNALPDRMPVEMSTEDDGDSAELEMETRVAPAETIGNPLVYAGIAIALVSLGLLVLSWFAHRRTADRLLR